MAKNDLTIKINGDVSDYKEKIGTVDKISKSMGESLKAVAQGAAIAFAGLTTAAIYSINEAKKLESITTQFEVLTGSATEASLVVKDLQKFSASTPFQFEGIAQAAQQLLGFQFAAEELPNKLREIGDVASAVGQPITDIALIFGQVSAAGKLTGERLLQFQERAIPIGPALAKTMGVAEESIKDLVSRGEVDFATFEKAFASLSREGGFAFGGMAKQSETLEGRISTLKDNISIFAANMGQQIAPVIKLVVTRFTEFIQEVQKSGSALEVFNAAISGTLKFAAYARQAFMNLGGIIGTVLAGAVESASAAMSGNFSMAKDIISSSMTEIGTVVKDNHKQLKQDLADIDESFSAQAQEREAAIREQQIANAEADRERKKEERLLEHEELSEQEEELRERDKENLLMFEEAKQKIIKNSIMSVREAERAVALERMKDETKERSLRLKEEVKFGKNLAKAKAFFRSEEVDGTKMMLNSLTTLSQSGNKELAAIGKAAGVARAIMNTAEGVTNALATVPYPLNLAAAASVGVAGAVQIATISSTKFANGGVYKGGIPGVDSIPALVKQNEIIAPTQNFEEVIGSVRAKREAENLGGGSLGAPQVQVLVSYDSPEASQIMTVKQVENERLGISQTSEAS
jgi:tape measure domain-containing protein